MPINLNIWGKSPPNIVLFMGATAIIWPHCEVPTTASITQCTMLDQGLPCFGHLDEIHFLKNMLVLGKLHFRCFR